MSNMTNIPVIEHNLFDYSEGTFTTYASNLMNKNFLHPLCKGEGEDRGFYLRGKRHAVLFLLSEEQRDADGDVTTWVFEPCFPDALRLNLSNVKVKVFNT